MERTWNGECFEAALLCWDSGQGRDDVIRRARERQAVIYFWRSMGMARPGQNFGEGAELASKTPSPRAP